jgi:uncharacterized membrane protein
VDTLISAAHALAWSVYIGGAITMEIILRYAQRTMPPSQVAVVCKNAGSRYRWVGLAALLAIGLTGLLLVLRIDDAALAGRPGDPAMSLSDPYGRTLVLLAVAWVALLAAVSSMAFWLHPAQSKRSHPGMTKDEIAQERQRVGRAISRMNRVLRFELVMAIVAAALGASLHAGGLF